MPTAPTGHACVVSEADVVYRLCLWVQALLLFANRPDNPQRVHERSRRKAAQHRQEEEVGSDGSC